MSLESWKLEEPPPGYQPGQTKAPLLWNIAVPLSTVAVTFACLRFYVRARLVRVVGKDDWLLLAAVILLCCLIGSSLWGTTLGIGKHQYDVNREMDPLKLLPVRYSFLYALLFSVKRMPGVGCIYIVKWY